jgi:hypothetical protein
MAVHMLKNTIIPVDIPFRLTDFRIPKKKLRKKKALRIRTVYLYNLHYSNVMYYVYTWYLIVEAVKTKRKKFAPGIGAHLNSNP